MANCACVMWLREVIKTGQAPLIEKAILAAKRIKTPLAKLEKRYTAYLHAANPGNPFATFASFGFSELDALAKSSVEKLALQHEATSRFGDALFADTPAEQFCIEALAGLERGRMFEFDDAEVDARFQARPDLMPQTLSDCLYELAYWHDVYLLRHSLDDGDQGPEAYAREKFTFRCLAKIRVRSKEEAIAVFRYLADSERMDDSETEVILLGLIGTPGA